MNYIEAFILGLVQGITEWLPISSSGHLVLTENLFNLHPPLSFNILLHLGSLIVVLGVFRKDITLLIKGLLTKDPYWWNFSLMLIIGTIPIAFIGFFFKDSIEAIYQSNTTVGVSLLITAIFLALSGYAKPKGKLTKTKAIIIGIAQSAAILPGVSRSGMTISTGLLLGVDRKHASLFSFLLFIPAITGATILELSEFNLDGPSLLGFAVTIISGWISLKALLIVINKNKFKHFAWYCLALALLILLL